MPEQVGTEAVIQLLREVYKQQGYIVIGFPQVDPRRLTLGWTTRYVFQFEMKKPFEAFEAASETEWLLQNELIKSLRPLWPQTKGNGAGAVFFKVRPVKKS